MRCIEELINITHRKIVKIYEYILVLILLTYQKYNKPTDTHYTVMAK